MIKQAMVVAGTMLGVIGGVVEAAPPEKLTVEPAKIMIAYFSWSPNGNTRYVAKRIQAATGGELFEIKPKTPYPRDSARCVAQAKKECRDGFKPELATPPPDLKKYDLIFVGSPNWCGTMAPPVATFLSTGDLAGKTIIPFFTHGGGGMQNCERDVKKLAAKGTVLPAKALPGKSIRSADRAIADWLKSRIVIRATR